MARTSTMSRLFDGLRATSRKAAATSGIENASSVAMRRIVFGAVIVVSSLSPCREDGRDPDDASMKWLRCWRASMNGVGLNPTHSRRTPMRSTQQFSITLPNDMADIVKAKVAAGEYATESEVIRDGLRALIARDRAVESWLRNEVAPAYDALEANPGRGRSGKQVRARLLEAHRKTTEKP